jgi:hypothetical protein
LLSASVVHDLGASFCKINPEALIEEKLGAKPSKKTAVSKPKSKKPNEDVDDPARRGKQAEDEPETSSKPKKGKK